MSAAPAKDNKQVIVVSVFGALLLIFLIYGYNAFFGGPSSPPPVAAPATVHTPAKSSTGEKPESSSNGGKGGTPAAAGVAATKMASTSASLDPTLDESAMLRTESLVYSGSGRNIFSAIYVPPVVIPKDVPKARPGPIAPPVPTGPPPPPPPPPINLKFFGTAVRTNGVRQAFLLNGEDVYLAAAGDIVARKYKIVSIGANSIQVEDLQYSDTQTLPLQAN
jgi:hypothetical protein